VHVSISQLALVHQFMAMAWMRWASRSSSSDEDEDNPSSLDDSNESNEVNGLPGLCSGNSVGNRVVFGFKDSI
jgi:hypothetical protein